MNVKKNKKKIFLSLNSGSDQRRELTSRECVESGTSEFERSPHFQQAKIHDPEQLNTNQMAAVDWRLSLHVLTQL